MRDLAFHYDAMRSAHPHDRLMIVFDIDGTIIDQRYMVLSVLQAYDREHGTKYFQGLLSDDITAGASDIVSVLKEFALPSAAKEDIAAWCAANFWSRTIVLNSHKPFHGVLDVIRWFQLQPLTFVGLNTSRDQGLREDTLHILNILGQEYHVKFDDALLCMNTGGPIAEEKANSIRYYREQGYRIVAVIDNERQNLDAMARNDPAGEMLMLHADTVLGSSRTRRAQKALSGNYFDLTELIKSPSLPRHIEFVWHGVDDESVLRQFLITSVLWAELHVRRHINGHDLILRRKRYAEMPPVPGEEPSRLDDFLYILCEAGKGVKLDLKDPGLTARTIEYLKAAGFTDERVWFTINMEEMRRGGLRLIRDAYPGAVTQCPVDTLGQLIDASPAEARECLGRLSREGIDRFSVNWGTFASRRIIIQLQNWGFEVNIYDVPDLEAFLQAALLAPKSITSYFNFPKWFYTGTRGDVRDTSWIQRL